MKQSAIITKRVSPWRLGVTLVLVAALAGILISNRHLVHQSVAAIGAARLVWLLAALVAAAATFLWAATIYRLLALHPLPYKRTVLVEVAASFANRLLPAGLGGLGLHGLYLHKQRHTGAEATAIVSINNLLGIMAHLSLLALVCLSRPGLLTSFGSHGHHAPWKYIAGGVVLIALLLVALPTVRRTISSFARNLIESLRRLTVHKLTTAYGTAICLTITYTSALYFSAHALHLLLSPLQIFIVFSIGMLAGTATPTPGGLVGIEAGLYAGLVGYGVTSAAAVATTLVYRLATYWLPLLPGFIALLIARQRKYV